VTVLGERHLAVPLHWRAGGVSFVLGCSGPLLRLVLLGSTGEDWRPEGVERKGGVNAVRHHRRHLHRDTAH
jgi:hypothetical protein